MRAHEYWVYILADGPCGWLYVGMTNDLLRRVDEHKRGQFDGQSTVARLVWRSCP